ncbi:M10 family metallopeptidase C-terminal domain-containing protein [Microvirga puerhi]|uniref:M10 family metallopeptidase C-terminal domain-containing protein n=1 Tax=Microvirga puerhi TaxID=2876078 RepID=A0ABS7VTQ4_9HYPH|nr:M10 family metallopeptidase C-terminal domain-containing protein [Microvirga puerhi]MBZ6078951.1 M10 family metallopeptidase C-terminal domain-containing protein [Microvirga puerhi]
MPQGGDVWFGNAFAASDEKNYGPWLALHETGHAMGLKHPFENGGGGKVSEKFDTFFYTVMAYAAAHSSLGDLTPDFFPTTPMYLDILAAQALYGRNLKHNSGSTKYTFFEGHKYFQTIDDAGGSDTITYVGQSSCVIDLRPGKFSTLSDPITLGADKTTRSTVCIGPNTTIEKAIGGSGNDKIVGNAANNTLDGRAGSDVLYGGAGKDSFMFRTMVAGDVDRLPDFNVKDDTIMLENGLFTALTRTGKLSSSFFKVGSAASDADDHIIYNKATGELSYDPDGSGAEQAFVFAKLAAGLKLTSADFVVI